MVALQTEGKGVNRLTISVNGRQFTRLPSLVGAKVTYLTQLTCTALSWKQCWSSSLLPGSTDGRRRCRTLAKMTVCFTLIPVVRDHSDERQVWAQRRLMVDLRFRLLCNECNQSHLRFCLRSQ